MNEDGISYWSIIKPILLVMIPIAVLLNFLPGPNGQPIMPFRDWLPGTDLLGKIIERVPGGKTVTGNETHIYKWQDEKGQWHFSESPPPTQQQQLEQITVTSDINTIRKPDMIHKTSSESPTFIQDFSLSELPNVLENAQKAKELMNQRAKQSEDL